MRRRSLFGLSGVAVELLGIGALLLAFPAPAAFLPALLGDGLAYALLGWAPRRGLPKRWEELLIVGLMGLAWLVAARTRDGFLAVAVFLAYAQVCFRLSRKQNPLRGLLWSFLSMVVASCFRPDIPFFLYLLLYAAIALVHLRERAELADQAPGTQAAAPRAGATASALRRAAGTLLSAVVLFGLAAALFPTLPRVAAPDSFFRGLRRVAGFSEFTDLSEPGIIGASGKLALRLTSPSLVRLRGRVYDRFTGTRWTSSFGRGDSRVFWGVAPPRGERLRQAAVQEATSHEPVVFAPLRLYRFTDAQARIFTDPNGNLWSAGGAAPARRFAFLFAEDPVLGTNAGTPAARAPAPPAAYLDVSGLSPRGQQLAASLLGSAPDVPSKIGRALAFFREGFEYTLDVRAGGKDPVDRFLFETRRGHCEFYASALALLLRAGGVPARYVTGYRPRPENRVGDSYYVFEDDAHAWVEALVPSLGWAPLDATPPGYPSGSGGVNWGPLQKRFLAWWAAYVISYSREDQNRLYAAAARAAAAAARARIALPGLGAARVPAAVAVAAALALAGALRPAARLIRAARAASAAPRSLAFYRAYERILRRAGYRRAPGETPLQLSERAAALGEAEAQRAIVRRYYALRFAAPAAGAEGDSAMAAALRALRRAARTGRPSRGTPRRLQPCRSASAPRLCRR